MTRPSTAAHPRSPASRRPFPPPPRAPNSTRVDLQFSPAPHPSVTTGRAPPSVMGVLNVTPDSFSDGGRYASVEAALAHGLKLVAQGARWLDVGGESARGDRPPVPAEEEIERVVPVVAALAGQGAVVSIDTHKPAVAEAAIAAGAAMVNDVSALLWDDRALAVVAQAACPVVLMHSPDPKEGGHGRVTYRDPVGEVFAWLEARVAAVVAGGVARDRIVVDPGIGFGKSLADNLALLNGLAAFHGLGCPVLLGASRKRLIGALSNEAPVEARSGGSVALALLGAQAGVQLLRVHDVAETVQAVRVWRGLRDRALVG